ncbi:hypothetical protein Tmar_0020 [Thermaerobacter marianensis DSM 12885]|uniref:Uncharacterized protein n=1 Tax=Thermaerobacter marianensis (strain ATCC 700841 / DSM 12885 / JCM 10246 / 7p75a) TaxID=644966 RepID=E6SKF8_THEM7|nr:hypothetical protein [Thermaerobacter marianensis]ADU50145.1 hypothetical protein Tmar_0020 [Thermaerobacter marianensis DSM 12885]
MTTCSTCGAEIVPGDIAYADPHDSTTLYCSADCLADACATTVIVDEEEHLPYHGGPTWTYDQAVEGLRRYLYLHDRLLTIARAWRLIAEEKHRDGRHMEAVSLQSCAAQIEDALADAVDRARGVVAPADLGSGLPAGADAGNR